MINQQTRIILLNGPSMSGKSSIIQRALIDELFAIDDSRQRHVIGESLAGPMKVFAGAAIFIPYDKLNKNAPQMVLGGDSIREFLIGLSETYMKPRYGADILGRLLITRLINHHLTLRWVVIDDCGFQEERDACIDSGTRPILIKVQRPGFGFKGDSRSFLPNPDYTLVNDSDEEALRDKCVALAKQIVVDCP